MIKKKEKEILERQNQKPVNLRRMVVLVIDMEDSQVSCDISQINDEMWKNIFSGNLFKIILQVILKF